MTSDKTTFEDVLSITDEDFHEMNILHFATHLTEFEEETPTIIPTEKALIENPVDHTKFLALEKTEMPLPNQSYYRSKAFSATTGINPLITAAAPLFSVIPKLHKTSKPDVETLHHQLIHEIKAFENKAQTNGYRPHLIMAARYVICALIDEVILNTQWGKECHWEMQNLVSAVQQETSTEDRFFLILERGYADPTLHIDLLELLYLCLSFGYEGKYRNIERGYVDLQQITDNLYHCIRQQRGEFPKKLLIYTEGSIFSHKKRWEFWHLMPLFQAGWRGILTLVLIIILSVSIFYGELYFHLKKMSLPIYQIFDQMNQAYEETV